MINRLRRNFLSFPVIVFMLIPTKMFAQNTQISIDSLKNIIHSSSPDSIRVNALNAYVKQLILEGNYDSAYYYNNESIRLGKTSGYKTGLAEAFADRGEMSSGREIYQEAIKNYLNAFKIYENLGDKKSMANMYNLIANSYHLQGDYPKALENQYAALKIREEISDEEGIAWSYNNIGTIYRMQGDLPAALKNNLESLKILEKFGDKKTIALAHNSIGNVYSLQDKHTDALQSYISSLRLRQQIGDKKDIIASYLNIGDAFCDLYEKDSLTDEVKVEYSDNGIYTINRTNWLDTAMSLHSKAHIMIEELDIKFYTIFSLSGKGRVNFLKKNYSESIKFYTTAYSIAEEMGALELQKEIAKYLSDNYNRMNDFKNGMEWYVKYEAHKDSVFNKLKSDDLTRTRLNYEFEKKEDEAKAIQERKDAIAKLELQRQKKMRNISLGGFVFVLVFAGIFFYQRNNIRKEKNRSDNLLLNILPSEIATELKQTGASKTKSFSEVTVMFADFVDFTLVSEKVSPEKLVEEIHTCFSAFDHILQKHKVEKIKTIGDAYLCAGGLPVSDPDHALKVVNASIEIMNYIRERRKLKESGKEISFELRIGIHSGPVVAGIVGVKKYAYDIWGDTVNIAARMEQIPKPEK